MEVAAGRILSTHVDFGELGLDVPDALLAAQHRDDFDLALLEAPIGQHAKRRDGRSTGSNQRWGQSGFCGFRDAEKMLQA